MQNRTAKLANDSLNHQGISVSSKFVILKKNFECGNRLPRLRDYDFLKPNSRIKLGSILKPVNPSLGLIEAIAAENLLEQEIASHEQKYGVADDIPDSCRISIGAGGEASAMHIQAASYVEQQRSEKGKEQKVAKNNGPRQPDTTDEQDSEYQLQPG
jgi:hypothetical protein